MKRTEIEVQCEGGLHLRIAAQIALASQRSGGAVHLRCRDCPWADGCSIMEILRLGAAEGTVLEVSVEGADEEGTIGLIEELVGAGAGSGG